MIAPVVAASEVPSSDPLGLVGATLASRYRVESLVAETPLSIVYRAVHRVWNRPVAIKAFRAPKLSEQARRQLLENFVREGAVLAELSERTASVCQARDVASITTRSGEWVPYLVLEWLDGEPLDLLLAREREAGGRRRTVEEALQMLSPIARALEIAHARGIVHRDVKPGNICVLSDGAGAAGATKLLDFGIATCVRNSGSASTAHVHSFTPEYGAPEQFCADYGAVGPWTDVFALALVFVELLVGREALQGEGFGELAMSACNPDLRPTPASLGVMVGDSVERVLRRALSVQPDHRFADAGQFWTSLVRAASDDHAVHH